MLGEDRVACFQTLARSGEDFGRNQSFDQRLVRLNVIVFLDVEHHGDFELVVGPNAIDRKLGRDLCVLGLVGRQRQGPASRREQIRVGRFGLGPGGNHGQRDRKRLLTGQARLLAHQPGCRALDFDFVANRRIGRRRDLCQQHRRAVVDVRIPDRRHGIPLGRRVLKRRGAEPLGQLPLHAWGQAAHARQPRRRSVPAEQDQQ